MYLKLGSEFMPPLNEGTILYMPTAVQPGMSVAEAQNALQLQDKILRTFPEVERVFGKAGRANTSTDPAPFSMMETTVVLKPEAQWRERPRWYSSWAPERLKGVLRPFWRDRITEDELKDEMNAALQLPGISNAWTMPIKGRLDMLSTGIRTPIGIKIAGAKLEEIERIGARDRGGAAEDARDPQRLRRARGGRLLPRLRAEARSARPLWAHHRRREHDGDDRGRRRRRSAPPSRGASATASTSATPATTATTCRRCAACSCRCRAAARSRWSRSRT